jgi:hypothetical protein
LKGGGGGSGEALLAGLRSDAEVGEKPAGSLREARVGAGVAKVKTVPVLSRGKPGVERT